MLKCLYGNSFSNILYISIYEMYNIFTTLIYSKDSLDGKSFKYKSYRNTDCIKIL